MAEFLKEERVKSKIEHPFFCVWVLVALLIFMHMSFTCIPRLKGRVTSSQKLVISLWLVFLVAILQTLLIEPDTQVDQAMHTFEGKLPDLVVFEDEEPVDALLRWGKIAAKEHLDENWTPIVRQPIYYEILDELCNQTESLTCTRTRAWEFLNMGAMAFTGNDYPIDYYNPEVDPSSRSECVSTILDGKANSCIYRAASQFCERLLPPPNNCARDIAQHIASQLETLDENRLDAKCAYQRFGLEMDAPGRELYVKAADIARKRGLNMSPFVRVDNGTLAPYDSWSKETAEAHAAIDTFHKIHDPECREWEDKPCKPYFNGAMCAKMDKGKLSDSCPYHCHILN